MGKVTDAFGLTNYKGEKQARADSIAASERANEISAESLAFQKEQYAEWKEIFGPVRKELAEYYNNLDANNFMSRALQFQRAEQQGAEKLISESLAQRGFDDSKFEQHLLATSKIAGASNRANIRATADDTVAQQKQSFLGIGLGVQQSHLGLIGQSYGQGIASNQHTSGLHAGIYQNLSNQNFQVKQQLIDAGLQFSGFKSAPKGAQ